MNRSSRLLTKLQRLCVSCIFRKVVSLSTVIAAEELLKEDQTKEDALNQIDASLPAASHQPQVEGLPALSQLELLYNLQVQQKLQIGADSEGTDKKSGPAAIPKPTAAASEKVMEIRPSSDALDAETVRIRQLQKQRALKAADIGAVTPRDELAEQNLAKSKVNLHFPCCDARGLTPRSCVGLTVLIWAGRCRHDEDQKEGAQPGEEEVIAHCYLFCAKQELPRHAKPKGSSKLSAIRASLPLPLRDTVVCMVDLLL